ncbi:SigE family RNA polymerase sigma factor [Nocardioides sp. LMS-CY]|uniref:SigE family RNA polymerase sigma factor n=1 Tax=Nocardioides sp. (strain LMS-CY) TaxID=2840457 RepID=UPI001C0019DE|nr:SigE family RNA polymerase sigma factor [Nocardioides sp. LMS-CY]QWF23643.1 SigE family RNA polymerase sigma factor [Nocardioides sp. LMS-CY]
MRRPASTDEEFAELVAACSPQLYRSAYLLTTSPHGAEDLVQTALAKAYASWWRVRSADDPVAYVHGVLTKSFLSERRRRSSRELPIAAPPDRPVTDADPTERAALMAALAELAPVDRAVVVLRFWEDRSVAQTAADLGLTEAAVKNRTLRALRSLRGLLADTSSPANGSAR